LHPAARGFALSLQRQEGFATRLRLNISGWGKRSQIPRISPPWRIPGLRVCFYLWCSWYCHSNWK